MGFKTYCRGESLFMLALIAKPIGLLFQVLDVALRFECWPIHCTQTYIKGDSYARRRLS